MKQYQNIALGKEINKDFKIAENVITTNEDKWLHIYQNDHQNPYMEELYRKETYVIKKKANYRERLTCGIIPTDNVYKVYEWEEE